MSPAVRLCSILTVALLALAGCGSAGSNDAKTTTDSSGAQTIDITFKGSTVDPEGEKVEVKAGEPVTLHITADKPGEIHVHSSPEQQIEYASGTTDKTLKLDQPGVVEVESHSLDKLILQLEVR